MYESWTTLLLNYVTSTLRDHRKGIYHFQSTMIMNVVPNIDRFVKLSSRPLADGKSEVFEIIILAQKRRRYGMDSINHTKDGETDKRTDELLRGGCDLRDAY